MQSLKINFLKYLLALVVLLSGISAKAQDMSQNDGIEMADAMRANGKIYVVVVCLSLIFLGIITYLVILNNKVNKLEKMKK
jgi:hypothetical protein